MTPLQQSSFQNRHAAPCGIDLSILDQFDGHHLIDLKNAQLMNRVDTKFLIPIAKLSDLLGAMLPYYSALDIDGTRIFSYKNVYFDTLDNDLYYKHHQGKLNRYKVRHRSYSETGTAFLEIKHKNSQSRTVKSRIACAQPCLNKQKAKDFLAEVMGKRWLDLYPTQRGSYQRIALANEACGERLTLDINLRFQTDDGKVEIAFPEFFIAELKQGQYSLDSPFARLMGRQGIRPIKFSKYCIGAALLNPSLKSNRFKPVLTTLNKFYKKPCSAKNY